MDRLRDKADGLLTYADYKKTGFKLFYGVMILLLILAALVIVIPVLRIVVSGLKRPEDIGLPQFFPVQWQWQNIRLVWERINFTLYFVNSLIVVAGAVFCSVFFNGLLAYAVAVVKPAGWRIVQALVLLSLMIPATTNLISLFKLIGILHLDDQLFTLMIIYGANAYYFVLISTYFKSLPQSVIEAAQIDGCNKFRIFYRIVAPLSLPIIMVVAIFTVNAAWSDFLFSYLVLGNNDSRYTVMVKIYDMAKDSAVLLRNELLIALTFSMLPPVLLFALFARQITANVATSGLKD